MKSLKINGTEKQFPDGKLPATLTKLLEHLDVNTATVAAEVDGQIIERKNFDQTPITQGQCIELVRFVSGG